MFIIQSDQSQERKHKPPSSPSLDIFKWGVVCWCGVNCSSSKSCVNLTNVAVYAICTAQASFHAFNLCCHMHTWLGMGLWAEMLLVAEQIQSQRTWTPFWCHAADAMLSLHGQCRQGGRDIPRDRVRERHRCRGRYIFTSNSHARAHFPEYNSSSPRSSCISYL